MKKKNILMIALSLCLIAVIAVSGTLAYFTDTTDASTNTFTMGQVKIDLTESTTDSSGDATSSSGGIEYVDVMPGDTRSKIVKVNKVTGSEDCYVAVLVKAEPKSTVPNQEELLSLVKTAVGTGNWTVRYLDADRAVLPEGATDTNSNGVPDDAVYSLYVYNDILTDTTEQTLFTEIKFPDVEWGNSYANASFDLVISAYAVQSDNFLTSTDDEGALVLPTNEEVADWFAAEGQLAAIEADNQTTTGTTEP